MYWQTAKTTLLAPFSRRQPPGLISDVDGTLSPIVDDPGNARISQRNRELLEELVRLLPLVAVVSGRSVEDVRNIVGISGVVYIGNHGLERYSKETFTPNPGAVAFRPNLEAAIEQVSGILLEGMFIEDKSVTLTVHFRQTANPIDIKTRFLPEMQRIAANTGLKLFQGRMVFEFRPPVEEDKGTAFRSLVLEHSLESAIFMGDDSTDASALRMARQLRRSGICHAVGLGVESSATPLDVLEEADLLVSDVPGVESFLEWLLAALRASST